MIYLAIIHSEVLFMNFLLEHNLPASAADHTTKFFSAMFPNSAEVRKYSWGRTITTEIIKELASESTNRIISILKTDYLQLLVMVVMMPIIIISYLYPIVITIF